METHSFTIVASGLDYDADDFEDRLFEAGCSDATVSIHKAAIILDFNRDARSFGRALQSAVADVEKAGARVVHVEPDHLVNLSDIADRAHITKAAVSNYTSGERGEGFPAPVVRVTTNSPLWDWVEVARWLHRHGRLSMCELLRARVVRSTNVAIMVRNAGHVGEFAPERRRRPNQAAA